MKICPLCKTAVEPDWKVCKFCGSPIPEESSAAQGAPVQPGQAVTSPIPPQTGGLAQQPLSSAPVFTQTPGQPAPVRPAAKKKNYLVPVLLIAVGAVISFVVVSKINGSHVSSDSSEDTRDRSDREEEREAEREQDRADKESGPASLFGKESAEAPAEPEAAEPAPETAAAELPTSTPTPTPTEIPQPTEFVPGHEQRYQFYKMDATWEEANAYAVSYGGHLATITSQTEMDYLAQQMENYGLKYAWLGGNVFMKDGVPEPSWVTGEAFSYQNWAKNQPSGMDDDKTPENYILLWNYNGWNMNDVRNDPISVAPYYSNNMGFIVEYEDAYYPWDRENPPQSIGAAD